MVVRHPFAESELLIFAGAKSGITIERFGLRSKCQARLRKFRLPYSNSIRTRCHTPDFFFISCLYLLSIALR
jgi:hypothetical protein